MAYFRKFQVCLLVAGLLLIVHFKSVAQDFEELIEEINEKNDQLTAQIFPKVFFGI